MKTQLLNPSLFAESLHELTMQKSDFFNALQYQIQVGSALLNNEQTDRKGLEQFVADCAAWDSSNQDLFDNSLINSNHPLQKSYVQIHKLCENDLGNLEKSSDGGKSTKSLNRNVQLLKKILLPKIILLNSYCALIQQSITEEKLTENDNYLKDALKIAKLGAYSIDIATGSWTASEELNEILGIDNDYEKTYEGGQAILHPDFRAPMAEYFYQEVITKRGRWDIEYKIIRINDGAERWVHGMGRLMVNENNEPLTLVATVQDITLRKRLETDLVKANEFNNSLIQSMQYGFAVVNQAGVQIQVNDSFCKMTGFDREELIGKSAPYCYWPPEEYDRIHAAFSHTLSAQINRFELTFLRKNGERFPVIVAPTPIKDKDGSVLSFAATIEDITQIKETQNQLKQKNLELQKAKNEAEENETRYRILVENAPEALVVIDLETQKFIGFSQSAMELFKMTEHQLLNSNVADISPKYQSNGKLSIDEAGIKIQEAVDGGKPVFEWTHQNTFGNLIPCEVKLVRLPSADKVLIRGSVTDISERKKAEEEMKISNERHLAILNNIDAGVVIHAPDTSIIHCNQKALDSLGLTEDEIYGRTALDPAWKFLDEHNQPLSINKFPVYQVISAKKPIQKFIVGVNRPKQQDVRWALVNGYPVLDESENILEIVISFIDITEHRRMEMDISERIILEKELKDAKERAEENEKLKTAFLQNMSHEIRTPLNAISGFIQMLDKPSLSPEKRKSYSSIILNSSNQLLSLVSDLLTISSIETNQEKINMTEVNINSIMVELLAIFKLQASNQNVFLYSKQNLTDKRSAIFSDKVKLTQVLTNLLSNALKFTHTGSIEFGYTLDDTKLQFYVKDTGIGIASDQQHKIFGRFQQAIHFNSAQYGGTGLGLAISKAFVDLLGGNIWVESTLGQGSTFYFTIPYKPVHVIDQPIIASNEKETTNITILIAEDVEINFLLLEELFNNMGCRTLHAKNGQIAVDMCANDPSIDLVFMDIKMPILDGYEAAILIKNDRPNLPIIAQSGYAFDDEREKYKSVFDEYISKPFDIEDLEVLAKKYIEALLLSRK